jgi:hypothetical protein
MGYQSPQSAAIPAGNGNRGRRSNHRFRLQFVLGLGCIVRHRFCHGFVLTQLMTDLMLAEFVFMFAEFVFAKLVLVLMFAKQGAEPLAC